MDRFARLPEDKAVQTFANELNERALSRLFFLLTLGLVAIVLVSLFRGDYPGLVLPLINLFALRWFHGRREDAWFLRRLRTTLMVFLTLQLVGLRLMFFEPSQSFHWLDGLLPLLLLLFHLPAVQAVPPLLALWIFSSGRHLVQVMVEQIPFEFAATVGQSALTIVVLSIVSSLRFRRQHQFLTLWREGNRRHRERLRLREELDAARHIQLGMLPKTHPNLPWLEAAGRSIPASEVGGDYYDYLTISDEQMAVVIGDVSGHGMASGLLLSGIRSCLYLLQETPLPPSEILAKLDRMIRKTTGRRVLVTMTYALFDRGRQTLTFSAAAHPPLLRYSVRTGEVEELSLAALPLGTRIGSTLREETVPFERGDIFIFVTDGIAEVLDRSGAFYGTERLEHCVQAICRQAAAHSAKQIRDAILNDLWTFKGDDHQPDDITLVVVRMR